MVKAWEVARPGDLESGPIELVDRPPSEPGPREVRIAVRACGVCRTDLHIAVGDLPLRRTRVIPGHEIVGVVDALGDGATRWQMGDRIGIAWLRWTCGRCRYCVRGDENLCDAPLFTGWDEDGGYAQHAVVREDYAYALPESFDDEHAAPLLCAGIIGYRALRRAALPQAGTLGIYGFGGSAHIALQVAVFEGATVHVVTRSQRAQKLALELGAVSARDQPLPLALLDSAILFAPSGALVPGILESLAKGGTLAIAGIHLSDIPQLGYGRHLFGERQLVSVTANTRADGRELLELAERIPIRTVTSPWPLDQADDALKALTSGEVSGTAVLRT